MREGEKHKEAGGREGEEGTRGVGGREKRRKMEC